MRFSLVGSVYIYTMTSGPGTIKSALMLVTQQHVAPLNGTAATFQQAKVVRYTTSQNDPSD
jgi:hypothetical protein